jgi:hypothetical protein
LTSTKCDNLQFKLQNHEFETEVRVLDVQGYDLILGIDWLSSFGQMTVDLHKEKKKGSHHSSSFHFTRRSALFVLKREGR